jgi:hypothetical protein
VAISTIKSNSPPTVCPIYGFQKRPSTTYREDDNCNACRNTG